MNKLRPIGTEFTEVFQFDPAFCTGSRKHVATMRVVAHDECANSPSPHASTYLTERVEGVSSYEVDCIAVTITADGTRIYEFADGSKLQRVPARLIWS